MQPVSTNNPLIKRVRQEAVHMVASMVDRCAESALTTLDEAERRTSSVAVRLQLSDARMALEKRRAGWRSDLPAKVDVAYGAALSSAREMGRMMPSATVDENDLTLIEEAEVARFVEASRLQQVAMPMVEQSLSRLDSLMSSVLGLPVVRADLNPLRPDVLCGTLLEMLDEQPDPPEVRSHWVRHLATPFGRELVRLYDSIGDLLEAQGVEEARYRLKLTEGGTAPPSAKGKKGDAVASDGDGSGGDVGSVDQTGLVQNQKSQQRALFPKMSQLAQTRPSVSRALIRDFLYQPQWVAEHDEPLSQAYYDDVQAQVAKVSSLPSYDEQAAGRAMARAKALSVVDRPARAVSVETPLSPQVWGEQASSQARAQTLLGLKSQAKNISQVLGMDAVRTLVEQVAGDGRVLAPVREAFVAMEPALLRMALADPRYFGDDAHPARRLIEDIAQRSFKYNDEFAENFEQFMVPVREAVRELNAVSAPGKSHFSQRVDNLQAQWKAEDEAAKRASEPGMQSMQFAQNRQSLADKIAWEFSLRSDLVGVPSRVVDFLFQDWSLVISHAQLTAQRSQLDPGGYLAVVTDLLWSVRSEAALRQPARLFEVVPGVVSSLRRGLNMLGKEAAETDAFFGALMRYHDPVLRLRRMRSARDVEASGFAHLMAEVDDVDDIDSAPVPLEQIKPRAAAQPWLGRSELAAIGFEEGLDSEPAPLETEAEDVENQRAMVSGSENQTVNAKEAGVTADDVPVLGQPLVKNKPSKQDIIDESKGFVPLDMGVSAKSDNAENLEAPAVTEENAEDAGARVRATLARLRAGDWVDLRVRGEWRRAQLVWNSDNGSLFMFVSQGGRPHSMTRRICEKLIRARYLRPVDVGAVVDKAIGALRDQTPSHAEPESDLNFSATVLDD
ncbi:MAG: DUF1631 family protein [Ottowia sp.]